MNRTSHSGSGFSVHGNQTFKQLRFSCAQRKVEKHLALKVFVQFGFFLFLNFVLDLAHAIQQIGGKHFDCSSKRLKMEQFVGDQSNRGRSQAFFLSSAEAEHHAKRVTPATCTTQNQISQRRQTQRYPATNLSALMYILRISELFAYLASPLQNSSMKLNASRGKNGTRTKKLDKTRSDFSKTNASAMPRRNDMNKN